mmetsp:Transcript_143770/g.253991  ORF Transcript_143770/g.253991 Transcript_143770/m.253991 type:complete len:849 (-) Transcript_143770:117-2663(-)
MEVLKSMRKKKGEELRPSLSRMNTLERQENAHLAQIRSSILNKKPGIEEEEEFTDDKLPIVGSMWFNILVNSMTTINTLQMGLEADHPDWTTTWTISENVFTAGFFLEMIVKLAVLRCNYFRDKANWLDGGLTLLGIIDCWILPLFGGAADLQSLSVLRILRLMRLARIVKLVRSFKPFVLVIQGVIQAIATTVNVFVLLIFIFYVFAIFLTEHCGRVDPDIYPGYSMEEEVIDEQELMVNYNPYLCFGSMATSMLTLFNMAIMAEWAEIVKPIAYKQGPAFIAVFIVFAMLVAFGVMNVMIGMIVDSVVAESRRLDEDFRSKEKQFKLRNLEKVQRLLEDMDTNHDQAIDIGELTDAMKSSEDLHSLLRTINLPCAWSPQELLDMLDNSGDGELQKAEFTTSFFRLLDSDDFQQICIMQASINQVKHLVRGVTDTINQKFEVMERDICSVKSSLRPAEGAALVAADTTVSEKAASEPCSEPGEQHFSMQCKEHAKGVDLSNNELTGFTDGVCKELKQTIEQISHKELADTIEHVSHKQLTETLDAAYTVMKESFRKELASMTPSLEGQLGVSRPGYSSALSTCGIMSGATDTQHSSVAERVAAINRSRATDTQPSSLAERVADRQSASSETVGVPIKGVPLFDTPTFMQAGMDVLSSQAHTAAGNSTGRPASFDGVDDNAARAADDPDFESVASTSQAGVETAPAACPPEIVISTHVPPGPPAIADSMAAAAQPPSNADVHSSPDATLVGKSMDQSMVPAAAIPRAVYDFKFEDGTPQLGFSVNWEPNDIPLVGGVLAGGAAAMSGVHRGDRLSEVNGMSTAGKSREEVLQLLKTRPLHLRMVRNCG